MLAAAVHDGAAGIRKRDGADARPAVGRRLRLRGRRQGQQGGGQTCRQGRQPNKGGGGARRVMMRSIMSSSGRLMACRQSVGRVSGESVFSSRDASFPPLIHYFPDNF